MRDKEFHEYISPFINDYLSHQEQLSTLKECYDRLALVSKSIKPNESDNLKYLIKKIQCQYLLMALTEINKSIIDSLNNKLFTVSEALSRIAIEYAVNLMFILEGNEHERAKSLLKHYITKSKDGAKKWFDYSVKVKDTKAKKCAISKLDYLANLVKENRDLVGNDVKGWKNARQRFSDVGGEKLYHVLFASASDSVHLLSEDIFNLTMIESLPVTMHESAFQGFHAEKASFAYYLSANALSFFAESLARLAIVMGEKDAEKEILSVGKKLTAVIQSHEDHADLYKRS